MDPISRNKRKNKGKVGDFGNNIYDDEIHFRQ